MYMNKYHSANHPVEKEKKKAFIRLGWITPSPNLWPRPPKNLGPPAQVKKIQRKPVWPRPLATLSSPDRWTSRYRDYLCTKGEGHDHFFGSTILKIHFMIVGRHWTRLFLSKTTERHLSPSSKGKIAPKSWSDQGVSISTPLIAVSDRHSESCTEERASCPVAMNSCYWVPRRWRFATNDIWYG